MALPHRYLDIHAIDHYFNHITDFLNPFLTGTLKMPRMSGFEIASRHDIPDSLAALCGKSWDLRLIRT